MTNKDDIQQELEKITVILAQSQNKHKEYLTPENYFSNIDTEYIIAEAHVEYVTPEDYFSTLQIKIKDHITQEHEGLKEANNMRYIITRKVALLSGIAASMFLLLYINTSPKDSLDSVSDYTEQEIDAYIEDNINDMNMDELLVFHEEDKVDLDSHTEDDELIDFYIEQNIYTLEEEFLSELIE